MNKINQWDEELIRLEEILQKTTLKKEIKWGAPVYTHRGKNVVGFAGFQQFFTLWFYQRVFLSDPYQIFISGTEGKTKALRQWRFQSMKEIDEKKILEYVNESIENGKILKPEKFTAVEIPIELKNEFEKDPVFYEHFQKLTPGKQKEYNL